MNNYRIDVFKETQDDWCPCFQNNLVEVSLFRLKEVSQWGVCVWGEDDLGYNIDLDTESEALTVFMQIIGSAYVNFDTIKSLGLTPF